MIVMVEISANSSKRRVYRVYSLCFDSMIGGAFLFVHAALWLFSFAIENRIGQTRFDSHHDYDNVFSLQLQWRYKSYQPSSLLALQLATCYSAFPRSRSCLKTTITDKAVLSAGAWSCCPVSYL